MIKFIEADEKVNKIIKDLQGDFGGDNKSQGAGLALLKGLAFSDDSKANEFMKKLDKATSEISKEVLGEGKKSEFFLKYGLDESTTISPKVSDLIKKLSLTLKAPYVRGIDGKRVDSIYKGVANTYADLKVIKRIFPDFKVINETAYNLAGFSSKGLFTYDSTEGDASIHAFTNKNELSKELELLKEFF